MGYYPPKKRELKERRNASPKSSPKERIIT
jgi:hypothetical protein